MTCLTPSVHGLPIKMKNGKLVVPHNPIIPYIEGDGTGPDIWRATVRVLDATVEKVYLGQRKFTGLRFMPEKKPIYTSILGCQMKPLMPVEIIWCP